MTVSRRTLLKTGAAVPIGASVGALAAAAPGHAARPDVGVSAYAFSLTAVRLLPGGVAPARTGHGAARHRGVAMQQGSEHDFPNW